MDRQTDIQIDKQIDRQIDRQIQVYIYGLDLVIDIDRWIGGRNGTEWIGQDRTRHDKIRYIDGWINRQIGIYTCIEEHMYNYMYVMLCYVMYVMYVCM